MDSSSAIRINQELMIPGARSVRATQAAVAQTTTTQATQTTPAKTSAPTPVAKTVAPAPVVEEVASADTEEIRYKVELRSGGK